MICCPMPLIKRYASQHYSVPVPSQDKLGRVVAERAFGIKMGDNGGGGTDSQRGWRPRDGPCCL